MSFFENLFLEFLSPFLAIYGLFRLVGSKREIFFWSGFFVGILWFYWVSFSLIYFGFAFAIPLEILFFGFAYGVFFLVCGLSQNFAIRAVLLALLGFFHPFSFNWLNLELILMPGIFEPNFRGLFAILAGICAFYYLRKFKILKFLAIFLGCVFALQISAKEANFLPFEIELVNSSVSQSEIWSSENVKNSGFFVLSQIENAVNNGKKAIVFAESALPFHLNKTQNLIEILKEKSHEISIILGSEAYENGKFFNSAYFFENGEMSRFDKVILVPFGEEIPLPNFLRDFINSAFFDGASDFSKAENFSTYKLNGEKITNAICYEATRPEIYENSPKFVIAISNNGWFVPSTEPNLQRILIKYFATKSGATIYHAANGSKSEIITPKQLFWERLK